MKIKHWFFKWMSEHDFLYRIAVAVIANRIVRSNDHLTPEHLLANGRVKDGNCFTEPNIKLRDKIWIEFEHHYFRVYHGEKKTFISLQKSKEWFENYYLLAHGDNGIYELAGI